MEPNNNNNKTHTSFLIILTLSLFLFTPTTITATATATATTIITQTNYLEYYTQHCNDVVPQSPTTGIHLSVEEQIRRITVLRFTVAHFTGGEGLIPTSKNSSFDRASLTFSPNRVELYSTRTDGLFGFRANLRFFAGSSNTTTFVRRTLREIRFRAPRIPVMRDGRILFDLFGFWSERNGKLCMVGSGKSDVNAGGSLSGFNAVLKLNYPVGVTRFDSFLTGVLESFGGTKGGSGFFEPVSILGFSQFPEYKYALVENGNASVCLGRYSDSVDQKDENLPIELNGPGQCMRKLRLSGRTFELENVSNDCGTNSSSGEGCNPLGGGYGIRFVPKFMGIQELRCEPEGLVRAFVAFLESENFGSGMYSLLRAFDPTTTLIAEGSWDQKSNRLCMVACRLLNFNGSLANASVGDCSVHLSLRFPKTLTIMHTGTVLGHIWSNKSVNDPGYFNRIEFHGTEKGVESTLRGMKYAYTVLDKVSKSCAKRKPINVKGSKYPDAYSTDMRFQLTADDGNGRVVQGFASPLFVSDQPYNLNSLDNHHHNGVTSISYRISFHMSPDSKARNNDKSLSEITAEGTYDGGSGLLCMIGCRQLGSTMNKSAINNTMDCEILINLQFHPVSSDSGSQIQGTIRSLRGRSDPLNFVQLQISSSSIYSKQAANSIWRMDMEIFMVLVSNTLACVFFGLQLYHVNKRPNVLPLVSFSMLIVLTLGHMVPLLLNFEAMFQKNKNRTTDVDFFLESGGWLEINEVLVRVVTMIAFLLQFRLLQLSWSSRQKHAERTTIWMSEKKVLLLTLPLYIFGGLIAWFIQQWKTSYSNPYLSPRRRVYQQYHPWKGLKSYGGLVLDGFLLPQIILNSFLNTRENVVAAPFYIGTTIVRLLPHAYDLYRTNGSNWSLDFSFIYANHRQDFYSTAWNIIILLVGLLFAGLVYMQQRFGGRFCLPMRFREGFDYQKIHVANTEEVQEESVP